MTSASDFAKHARAVVFKPRSRAGSWETFVKRYGPKPGPEGNELYPWDHADVRAADERHVWTVVDCDGVLYVTAGLATVNYMGRIITARPWDDSEQSQPGYRY